MTVAHLEVVLDVHGRHVSLPRPFVEIMALPPRRWTVVARPPDAVRVPLDWGTHYAVCPKCQERQALERRTTAMRCRRCAGRFEIARSEAYLAVG